MSKNFIRTKGQLTIPQKIREAAHLEEGDPVVFEVIPEGILIRPQKVIDASQAWFWTPEWQLGEAEATRDIQAGRVEFFKDSESFLDSFKP